MVKSLVLEIDDRLELGPDCFGVQFIDERLVLPGVFAELRERYKFRTALQFVSTLQLALPDVAVLLQWSEADVQHSFKQLLKELQARSPRTPPWGQRPEGLRTPLGVMPPAERSRP